MSEKTKPAISVRGVTKTFRIPLDGKTGIKQWVTGILKHKKGYRDFMPLNGVSFEIEKGDFFGIVGRNGSGKSTLLKTIAGIYNPDKGSVKVNGLLVPFIELGVGFNPELSGRENVYLNAALLGFSRKETAEMYDEIVDFAELHDFMEEKLKNYSSGMQVRLAFSIAIRAKGDILLLDEVLAVGDSAFQQKCFDYFEKIKEEHRTIVLVTHSMDTVKRFCNRALLLDEGKVKLVGSPEQVADQYTLDNIPSRKSIQNDLSKALVQRLTADFKSKEYRQNDTLEINFEYSLSEIIPDVFLALSIIRDGRSVAEINSIGTSLKSSPRTVHKASLLAELRTFNPGLYSVNISIFKGGTMEMLDFRINIGQFLIGGNDQTRGGSVFIDGTWQVS